MLSFIMHKVDVLFEQQSRYVDNIFHPIYLFTHACTHWLHVLPVLAQLGEAVICLEQIPVHIQETGMFGSKPAAVYASLS